MRIISFIYLTKKGWLIAILFLFGVHSYSQNLNNNIPFYNTPELNPAFTGNKKKKHWSNFRPEFQQRFLFQYQTHLTRLPLNPRQVQFNWDRQIDAIGGGLGFNYSNIRIGHFDHNQVGIKYAYVIPISRKLSLRTGIAADYRHIRLDTSKLVYQQPDPVINNLDPTTQLFNFSAGAMLEHEKYRTGISVRNITSPIIDFGSATAGSLPISITSHFEYKLKFEAATIHPQLILTLQDRRSFGQVGLQTNYGKMVVGYHLRKGIKTRNSQGNLLESIGQLGANLNTFQLRYSLGKVHNSGLNFWKHEFGIAYTPFLKTANKIIPMGNPEF